MENRPRGFVRNCSISSMDQELSERIRRANISQEGHVSILTWMLERGLIGFPDPEVRTLTEKECENNYMDRRIRLMFYETEATPEFIWRSATCARCVYLSSLTIKRLRKIPTKNTPFTR